MDDCLSCLISLEVPLHMDLYRQVLLTKNLQLSSNLQYQTRGSSLPNAETVHDAGQLSGKRYGEAGLRAAQGCDEVSATSASHLIDNRCP